MASTYTSGLISLIYITCVVQSVVIRATLNHTLHRVIQSEHINENNLNESMHTLYLSLNSLTHPLPRGHTLDSVIVENFNQLWALEIYNISLGTMPTLRNLPKLFVLKITRNKIKQLSASVFNELDNLAQVDMPYNQIETIANETFKSELRVLELRCNKLTSFSHTWFHHPELLAAMDLSGNRIGRLRIRAFERLTKLRVLNLFNNQITTIDSAAFGYSPTLALHLGFNNLSDLSANMFASDKVVRLNLLRVDYNQLSFLSDDILRKVRIESMSIDGNPWQCPCLRKIEKWTPQIEIEKPPFQFSGNESVPVCVVANSFANVCVPYVDSELMMVFMDSLSYPQGNVCGKKSGIPPVYYRWTIWPYLVHD